MTDQDRAVLIIAVLLWLLWKKQGTWSDVNMCYVDPDTGECLPVPGA